MTVESCDVHLEGSLLPAKEVKALTRQNMKNLEKSLKDPKNLEEMKALLFVNLKSHVEDGIDKQVRQVADLVRVQDLYQKYTVDPISGQTLKAAGDVIHNRLKALVGRNSVDTRLRNLRNHFRNYIDEFELRFRTHENATYKSLRDIKSGSEAERLLYKKVYEYTEQMDVDKLTPEVVNGLLKQHPGEIDRLALSLIAYNEYSRRAMGKFGVSVKFNHNYVMKRRYDWAALEKMGPQGFAGYMVDRLHIGKSFGENVTREQAYAKLLDVYKEMETNAMKRSSVLDFKGSASRANSLSVKFFWKDSDAAYDAFRDLSVGGMREQFEKNAMGMASTAIKVSEFGYDADMVMNRLNEKINKAYSEKRNAIDQWRESRILQAERELTGNQNNVQGAITNFSNNVRLITAVTKLGTTLATTVADAVENSRQVFYVDGDFLGGAMGWVSNMTKMLSSYSKEDKHEIANALGIIFSHQSNAEGMRLATGDLAVNGGRLTQMIQEYGGKAMNITTLLPTQTGLSKLSSGLVGAQRFSKLVDDAVSGKLNKFQLDTMKEYGLSDKELAFLAKHAERTSNWSSTAIFTGNNIRKILETGSPELVAKELGIDPMMAGKAVLDLATKYESFVNDFVTRGTPTPELGTKTLMFKGVEDERIRAAINLATQFMDTPLAQAENFVELARKLKRINTKDGKLDMAGITGDVLAHSAVYLPVGIGLYLAADAVMSAVTNSESAIQQIYNGDADTRRRAWTKAISRTGFIPYLAEVIDNQWGGGYNKTALDTFGGPNLSTARDLFRLAQTKDDGGMELSQFAKRHMGANAIPVRALNNWSAQVMDGEKLFDDRKGTFF